MDSCLNACGSYYKGRYRPHRNMQHWTEQQMCSVKENDSLLLKHLLINRYLTWSQAAVRINAACLGPQAQKRAMHCGMEAGWFFEFPILSESLSKRCQGLNKDYAIEGLCTVLAHFALRTPKFILSYISKSFTTCTVYSSCEHGTKLKSHVRKQWASPYRHFVYNSDVTMWSYLAHLCVL